MERGPTEGRKTRIRPGEGAPPQAQTRGGAPAPAALRASTSPRKRGEVESVAALDQSNTVLRPEQTHFGAGAATRAETCSITCLGVLASSAIMAVMSSPEIGLTS